MWASDFSWSGCGVGTRTETALPAVTRQGATHPPVNRAGGRPRGRLVLAALTLLSAYVLARPTVGDAQEPVVPDTVRRDTLLTPLPDSVRAVFGDTTEAEDRRVPAFPEQGRSVAGASLATFECDVECIHASTAVSLLELLVRQVPGMTTLRAGFFGGPHHVLSGPFGPGNIRLLLDGREIPPLESGQTDLLRLSLVYLERIRVYRRADGYLIEVTTRRHRQPQAYSRIAGGSGSPNIQMLNGLFQNGLGSSFTIGGAFDLFDAKPDNRDNNHFDFWGRLSWMPGTNDFGIQFDYRTQTLERTASDTVEFDRRDYVLRVRGNLPMNVQTEAYIGEAKYRVDGETLRGTAQGGVEFGLHPERGYATLGAHLASGDAYAKVTGLLRGGYRPLEGLTVDGEATLENWAGFTATGLRLGSAYEFRLLVPLTVRADAATGVRGVPRPTLESADSVGVDALALSAEAEVGEFRFTGRAAHQRLSRQLPFYTAFDSLLAIGEETEFASYEMGVSGPVVPLNWLVDGLSPIRLTGYWQRNDVPDPAPIYTPQDLISGELSFHDDFFGGNLEVWVEGSVDYRSATLSAETGESERQLLPSYTWFGGHLMLRIGSFRLFYRLTNPGGLAAEEVGGVLFPTTVNMFGVRWEFFN